jgi:hypothetical protein
LAAKTRPPQTTAVAEAVGCAAGEGFASVRPTSAHDSTTTATARSHATRIAIAGWLHFATKAPRPLDIGRAWPEVEVVGDPSNEPQRPVSQNRLSGWGELAAAADNETHQERPSVRAHRTRGCATRQSCTREHDATVEAAPLRAASPSRSDLGEERRRPLLRPSIFSHGRRRSFAFAVPPLDSLSEGERASLTRSGVIGPAIAPVRCEEETRPVSSAAPASISSGDIRASLL